MWLKHAYYYKILPTTILHGHISFPLILDLSPLLTARLGATVQDVDAQSLPLNLQHNRKNSLPNHYNLQPKGRMLKLSGLYEAVTEQINSDDLIDDESVSAKNGQELHNDTMFPCSGASSEGTQPKIRLQPIEKMNVSRNSDSQETFLY